MKHYNFIIFRIFDIEFNIIEMILNGPIKGRPGILNSMNSSSPVDLKLKFHACLLMDSYINQQSFRYLALQNSHDSMGLFSGKLISGLTGNPHFVQN